MKIRMHRGGLDDSMQTMQEIEPTCTAIMHYLRQHDVADADMAIMAYGGIDNRTGWDTHLVEVAGLPVAFTNGLPNEFYA